MTLMVTNGHKRFGFNKNLKTVSSILSLCMYLYIVCIVVHTFHNPNYLIEMFRLNKIKGECFLKKHARGTPLTTICRWKGLSHSRCFV